MRISSNTGHRALLVVAAMSITLIPLFIPSLTRGGTTDQRDSATDATATDASASAQPEASQSSSSPPPSNAEGERRFAEGVYISGQCPTRRCISFTFDDGPAGPLTARLLDILDEHHIHATFFVEGQHLDNSSPANEANRAVLREAHRRGHFIGNHTYRHPVLNHLNDEQLASELDVTSHLIAQTIGEPPGFFRAPYGMLGTARAIRAVYHRGYTVVRWMLDPRDWAEHTPEAVLHNFRYQLHIHPQGGILLLHDVHAHTIAAFPMILDEIDRQNRMLAARHEPIFQVLALDQFYQPRHHSHRAQ